MNFFFCKLQQALKMEGKGPKLFTFSGLNRPRNAFSYMDLTSCAWVNLGLECVKGLAWARPSALFGPLASTARTLWAGGDREAS